MPLMGWGSAYGSVLQRRAIRPACRALLIQGFDPFTTTSSPSVRARWSMPADRNRPGFGECHGARISPVAMPEGSVASAPRCRTARSRFTTTAWPPIAPAKLIQPRESAWVTPRSRGIDTGDPAVLLGTDKAEDAERFIRSIRASG